MKNPKLMNVELDLVDVPQNRNVRESVAESYDSPNMRESLATFGQQTTAKLLKHPNGRFEPVQGFRRAFNMKILKDQGIIDPTTAKRDDEGKILVDDAGHPIGGRPFSTIRAEVYEGLSELERIDLVIDHGDVRQLNQVELQTSFEELFRVGRNERETVVKLKSLIEQYYPPSRKIKDAVDDNGADLLKHYRMVVQLAKRVWKAPVVLRDAYLKRLRKQQAWPTNSEIIQLFSTYEKEQSHDGTGTINRMNPGPDFRGEWDDLVSAKTSAGAEGKRPKSKSMMGHEDVKGLYGTTDSRILKGFNLVVRRLISHEKLPLLDVLCVELEKGMTDLQRDQLNLVFADFVASQATTATEPPTATEQEAA